MRIGGGLYDGVIAVGEGGVRDEEAHGVEIMGGFDRLVRYIHIERDDDMEYLEMSRAHLFRLTSRHPRQKFVLWDLRRWRILRT